MFPGTRSLRRCWPAPLEGGAEQGPDGEEDGVKEPGFHSIGKRGRVQPGAAISLEAGSGGFASGVDAKTCYPRICLHSVTPGLREREVS